MFKRRTKSNSNEKGIAELFEISLGSEKQWLLIRGEDVNNPILLFLHGGPGTTNIGIAATTQKELEKDFIVVNWDQLGAGLSFRKGISKDTMTLDKMVEYTKELMAYLLERFDHNKLYLVGHSWGSLLGIMTAKKYPQYIEKYVGVSQFAGGNESEKYAYDYCIKMAKQTQNKKALIQLKQIGVPPYKDWMQGLRIRSTWSSKLGGTVKTGNLQKIYIKNMLLNTEYHFMDLYKFLAGFTFSLSSLWPEVMKINLYEHVSELTVPAYFFLGKYDYTAPSILAEKFIENLKAPLKEIIWFNDSAHMCTIEEPVKFNTMLVEILKKTSKKNPQVIASR